MDYISRVNYEIEINNDEMQSLQDTFCSSNDMYVMCVDKSGGQLTSFSGSKLEEEFVDANFPSALRNEIIASFVDGAPENIVECPSAEDYFICKGVAIRGARGEVIGAWLCFGVNGDKITVDSKLPKEIMTTTAARFDKSVGLIEVLTAHYFREKLESASLRQKLLDMKQEHQDDQNRLDKNEIMTSILRQMESDKTFDAVAGDILTDAGKYINCTNTVLIQMSSDGTTADIIREWSKDDKKRISESFKSVLVSELPFMNGKPYTISSDAALPDAFEIFFKQFNIDAAILLPLNVNDAAVMYLGFISVEEARQWSVDDIRFANDIKHILHTILVKKIAANSLASSYSALEAILQNAGYGVVVADLEKRRILYTNDTFKAMFDNDIDKVAVQDLIFDKHFTLSELNGYSANGSGKWFDITLASIKWVDNRSVRLITFYDTTDIRNYQKKAEKQAQEDSLTGLYNRQACERDIALEYHVSTKLDKEFAVLMFDLDNFSSVNEGYGYQLGDDLLEFIARSINDISAIKGHCYRVGGDEFAVLIDHEHVDNLDFVVKRIMNLFDNPWIIDDKEYYVTISMVALKAPGNITEASAVLTRLSIALHGAKDSGKNNFEFYSEKTDLVLDEKLKLEQSLRQAVDGGCKEFIVTYQPIMEFVGGVPNCCGAEALVRWNSKELGLVTPEHFIEDAERLDLIGDIGAHVLYEAAKSCKHWNDFGHPEYKVNVNLSYIQLAREDFVDELSAILKKTAITPENLTLEIAESIELIEMDQLADTLTQIRSLGCRIALDDFGAGTSSLNHLKNLPIDTIKIDRKFIVDMASDGFSQAFVKTVSQLADSLDVDVCVEGVEENQQVDMLGDFPVNLAQGFFFDKPLSKKEFEKKYL